ncbi:MAG: Xaa-Pro aminopeptidase [Gammaproteobacteria bacterium]|nr:Xaa-Pro aminopeptidase [Gammaproteobacteria bacterium]
MTSEFSKRRQRLLKQMGPNSMAILPTATEKIRNRDVHYPFRPDSDFYYLTGFSEPESVMVLLREKSKSLFILFCRQRDRALEIWNGHRYGPEGAIDQFGADEAYDIDTLHDKLGEWMGGIERIFYTLGQDHEFDQLLTQKAETLRNQSRSGANEPSQFISLAHIIHQMRLVKSNAEIKLMQRAANIASEAHIQAMQQCKPGMNEYEINAELTHCFMKHGSHSHAYPSIVAGGKNACILHYTENNSVLNDGDLLLIDAGAEYANYASDITRTFPVNGRFSAEQRALYDLVLDAQLAAIKKVQPGARYNVHHDTAVRVLTKGLIKLGLLKGDYKQLIKDNAYKDFYMHRTGHWLGMDVHDVGPYKQGQQWLKLRPGMVLTVEPGLYISADCKKVAKRWRGIGIRIEDDIVVTRTGNKVLSAGAPKHADNIEAIMQAA